MAMRIAYFISPHGFGHAARACAVMDALYRRDSGHQFKIFTRAPRWFFENSLQIPFEYHELVTDVGMVQRSPLEEDLGATIERLNHFVPFSANLVESIAKQISDLGCRLAVCDISPLGIEAARGAAIPVVLVENFTWDWIYTGYLAEEARFSGFIQIFSQYFERSNDHIQTIPVCLPDPQAALVSNPVARRPRNSRAETRARLNIPAGAPAVLVSMGGYELKYDFLDCLERLRDIYFIVPGGADQVTLRNNLALIPHHSEYYHPDLVFAADAIISKAGYSTIAEAYFAGIPYGYVSRARFRESPVLSAFIQERMAGFEISGERFQSGDWINSVRQLLQLPRRDHQETPGADQIAEFLARKYIKPGKIPPVPG